MDQLGRGVAARSSAAKRLSLSLAMNELPLACRRRYRSSSASARESAARSFGTSLDAVDQTISGSFAQY